MNLIAKVGIGTGAIAGVSGGAYGIYHNITTSSTYAEIFKGTLLTSTGTEHETNWKARLTSLKEVTDDTKLAEGLKEIKSKSEDTAWTELRDWCKDNVNNQSKGEKDIEFQNIQSYCTFSIKEKIKNAIPPETGDSDDKWSTAHEELRKINEVELDNTLKSNKEKTISDTVKQAIKTWCTAAYKKPYKGENDQEFKNASRICIIK